MPRTKVDKRFENIRVLCEQKKLMPMFNELMAQMKQIDTEFDWLSCFTLMLQAQLNHDGMMKISRMRRAAKLRWSHARIEDFTKEVNRCAEFSFLTQLTTCTWLTHFQHIIITGPAGAGKTHLACALANAAIELGHSALYIHFQVLIRRLKVAERAGPEELIKLKNQLAKFRLIVIDDWGIQVLTNEERHLLFELVEMRDQNASLLITSQHPTEKWHDAFQDKAVADSVLDRIKSYAIEIDWDLESYRRKKGLALKQVEVKGGAK